MLQLRWVLVGDGLGRSTSTTMVGSNIQVLPHSKCYIVPTRTLHEKRRDNFGLLVQQLVKTTRQCPGDEDKAQLNPINNCTVTMVGIH